VGLKDGTQVIGAKGKFQSQILQSRRADLEALADYVRPVRMNRPGHAEGESSHSARKPAADMVKRTVMDAVSRDTDADVCQRGCSRKQKHDRVPTWILPLAADL